MCHILIVLSLKSVKFPEVHRDAGASAWVGPRIPLHTSLTLFDFIVTFFDEKS